MRVRRKTHRILSKGVAAAIAVTLAFPTSTPGLSQTMIGIDPKASSNASAALSDSLSIPSEMGSIQVQSQGHKDRPFVVYIQDAHAITSAQNHIRELIAYLQENYGFDLIALEGAQRELDPTLFRTFPDAFVRKKVLEQYFKRAELSGVALASIINPADAAYHGIEDWNLYRRNYAAYLQSLEQKETILQQVATVTASLDQKRDELYPEVLNRLHEAYTAFKAESSELMDFLRFLIGQPRPDGFEQTYPELSTLMKNMASDDESSNANLTDSVRKMAAAFQTKRLSLLDKKQTREFNQTYQSFRTGSLDALGFLSYLVQVSQTAGLKIQLSPQMKKALGQQETVSAIRGTRLFDQLERYIAWLEDRLSDSQEAKFATRAYRQLWALKDLAALEWTREQFLDYQQDPESYLALLGKVRGAALPALEFYRLAMERDRVFHQNLRDLIKKRKTNRAIVITGGFHATGFEEELKRSGDSYAIIMPKIESLEGQENYQEIMEGKVSYKKYFQKSLYDAFIKDATEKMMGELDAPSFKKILKGWRDDLIRQLAKEGRIEQAANYTPYIDRLLRVYGQKHGTAFDHQPKSEAVTAVNVVLDKFRQDLMSRLWSRFEDALNKTVANGIPPGDGGGISESATQKALAASKLSAIANLDPSIDASAILAGGQARPFTLPHLLDALEQRADHIAPQPDLMNSPAVLSAAATAREQAAATLAETADIGSFTPQNLNATIDNKITAIKQALPPTQLEHLKAQGADKAIASALLAQLRAESRGPDKNQPKREGPVIPKFRVPQVPPSSISAEPKYTPIPQVASTERSPKTAQSAEATTDREQIIKFLSGEGPLPISAQQRSQFQDFLKQRLNLREIGSGGDFVVFDTVLAPDLVIKWARWSSGGRNLKPASILSSVPAGLTERNRMALRLGPMGLPETQLRISVEGNEQWIPLFNQARANPVATQTWMDALGPEQRKKLENQESLYLITRYEDLLNSFKTMLSLGIVDTDPKVENRMFRGGNLVVSDLGYAYEIPTERTTPRDIADFLVSQGVDRDENNHRTNPVLSPIEFLIYHVLNDPGAAYATDFVLGNDQLRTNLVDLFKAASAAVEKKKQAIKKIETLQGLKYTDEQIGNHIIPEFFDVLDRNQTLIRTAAFRFAEKIAALRENSQATSEVTVSTEDITRREARVTESNIAATDQQDANSIVPRMEQREQMLSADPQFIIDELNADLARSDLQSAKRHLDILTSSVSRKIDRGEMEKAINLLMFILKHVRKDFRYQSGIRQTIDALKDRLSRRLMQTTVTLYGDPYKISDIIDRLGGENPRAGFILYQALPDQPAYFKSFVRHMIKPEALQGLKRYLLIYRQLPAVSNAYADAGLDLGERSNRQRLAQQQEQIFELGERYKIAAHGIEASKGGLGNLLKILLDGKIVSGEAGGLVSGDPLLMAGPHGPFYIIVTNDFGWQNADQHIAYLVPEAADRYVIAQILREAAKPENALIDPATVDLIIKKTVTYDEFLKAFAVNGSNSYRAEARANIAKPTYLPHMQAALAQLNRVLTGPESTITGLTADIIVAGDFAFRLELRAGSPVVIVYERGDRGADRQGPAAREIGRIERFETMDDRLLLKTLERILQAGRMIAFDHPSLAANPPQLADAFRQLIALRDDLGTGIAPPAATPVDKKIDSPQRSPQHRTAEEALSYWARINGIENLARTARTQLDRMTEQEKLDLMIRTALGVDERYQPTRADYDAFEGCVIDVRNVSSFPRLEARLKTHGMRDHSIGVIEITETARRYMRAKKVFQHDGTKGFTNNPGQYGPRYLRGYERNAFRDLGSILYIGGSDIAAHEEIHYLRGGSKAPFVRRTDQIDLKEALLLEELEAYWFANLTPDGRLIQPFTGHMIFTYDGAVERQAKLQQAITAINRLAGILLPKDVTHILARAISLDEIIEIGQQSDQRIIDEFRPGFTQEELALAREYGENDPNGLTLAQMREDIRNKDYLRTLQGPNAQERIQAHANDEIYRRVAYLVDIGGRPELRLVEQWANSEDPILRKAARTALDRLGISPAQLSELIAQQGTPGTQASSTSASPRRSEAASEDPADFYYKELSAPPNNRQEARNIGTQIDDLSGRVISLSESPDKDEIQLKQTAEQLREVLTNLDLDTAPLAGIGITQHQQVGLLADAIGVVGNADPALRATLNGYLDKIQQKARAEIEYPKTDGFTVEEEADPEDAPLTPERPAATGESDVIQLDSLPPAPNIDDLNIPIASSSKGTNAASPGNTDGRLSDADAIDLSFENAVTIGSNRFRRNFLEQCLKTILPNYPQAGLPLENRQGADRLQQRLRDIVDLSRDQGLAAHGVAFYKGGIFNLIGIILTGFLYDGANRGSLSDGQAIDHGPYFILGDQQSAGDWRQGENFRYLLVPESSDAAFLKKALETYLDQRSLPLEKQQTIRDLLSKIITYDEFISRAEQRAAPSTIDGEPQASTATNITSGALNPEAVLSGIRSPLLANVQTDQLSLTLSSGDSASVQRFLTEFAKQERIRADGELATTFSNWMKDGLDHSATVDDYLRDHTMEAEGDRLAEIGKGLMSRGILTPTDIREAVLQVFSTLVFGAAGLEIVTAPALAEESAALGPVDSGKVELAIQSVDAKLAELLLNNKEKRFSISTNDLGGNAELANELIDQLLSLSLLDRVILLGNFSSPWKRLSTKIAPAPNERRLRQIIGSGADDTVVCFWTRRQDTTSHLNLGVYTLFAEIEKITDKPLRKLAIRTAIYALLKIALLDEKTRKQILSDTTALKNYLQDSGILVFLTFGKDSATLQTEALTAEFSAVAAVRRAA